MRVTANTFPNALVEQLSQLAVRQNRLQNQAANGQRIELPEDDPAAMRRVLDLQANARAHGQYQRNVAALQDLANASYAGMKGLKKLLDRAGEIAVLADGTKSPAELNIYATEVTQLIRQAVQIANERHQGNYLFAGTASDQPPFVETLDVNGRVVSVAYQGNTALSEVEISAGVTLSTQSIGANSSGTGPRGLVADSRVGADFFNHLISLQDNLLAGDSAAIVATNLPQLGRDEDNFLFHFGTVGAQMERLETTDSILSQQLLSLEQNVSREVDADLAQTLVRLKETQTAYEAALQSGARMLGQSLLDFLQ